MSNLRTELKEKIIEQLNLEEMEVSDIDTHESLFGDGLGLDSIDALELIMILEKDYGVKLENPNEGKDILNSVDSMATYIEKHQAKK